MSSVRVTPISLRYGYLTPHIEVGDVVVLDEEWAAEVRDIREDYLHFGDPYRLEPSPLTADR